MSTKTSFSARLSLYILIVTSILYLGAISVADLMSHNIISAEATESAENLLQSTILTIEKTLSEVEMTVRNSSWLIAENLNDPEYLYHITNEIVEDSPNIVGSAIAFRPNYYDGQYFFSPYSYWDEDTGGVISKQLGNQQYNYFHMDWYQVPYLLQAPSWSEPYYDDGGAGYLMSTYSLPLMDADGNVYAIMTADLQLDWISAMLKDIKPYPNAFVMLVSRCGNYISLGEGDMLKGETIYSTEYGRDSLDANLTRLSDAVMSGNKGVMQYYTRGKKSFLVYGPLTNGWKAAITCKYEDVLASTSKMHKRLLLLGLIGLLALFALCYFTIRHLTKPLSEFTGSALNIAKGDFDTPLPEIHSEDEIMTLRNSFDYMQHSLKDYIQNLKQTTAANERYESELNIASKLQMAMLPVDFPNNDKLDLSALLKPAREVGGDLYDFVFRDKYLYFTVGDVSGKGVPASLIMAITRSAFRFISGLHLPLDQVVSNINNSLTDGNDSNMFVTLFVGRLNLENGELEYCNAGHNPIVLIDSAGKASFLPVKANLAVGLFMDFPYQMQTMHLDKGSSLLLYTDGVTEAERADKSQYGEDRLIAWADALSPDLDAAAACADLMTDLRTFTEGNEQNDDITIMKINIK